jgi:ATP-dependent helicase/nuclease subunit A
VAPHFETIDDRTAGELMAEARAVVLTERCREDDHLARAVEVLAVTLAETTLADAIEEMLGQRHRLAAAFARCHAQGRCEGLLAEVDRLLEVEAGVEPPHLEERVCADPHPRDASDLRAAAQAMLSSPSPPTSGTATSWPAGRGGSGRSARDPFRTTRPST